MRTILGVAAIKILLHTSWHLSQLYKEKLIWFKFISGVSCGDGVWRREFLLPSSVACFTAVFMWLPSVRCPEFFYKFGGLSVIRNSENEWLCKKSELVWVWVEEGIWKCVLHLISLLAIVIALREGQLEVNEWKLMVPGKRNWNSWRNEQRHTPIMW